MELRENAAYIKGLCDGLDLDKTTKEGKVISALLDLVANMAEKIEDLGVECKELRDYAEELDEDLGYVEEDLYLTEDADDDDDEDFEDDFDEEFEDDFDNDFEGEDSGYDEFVCPSCGEVICVDQSLDIADVTCPACGEKLGDIDICDGDCEGCEGCAEDEE